MLGEQCGHGRVAIFSRKDDQIFQNGGADGVGQLIGSGEALLLDLDTGSEIFSGGAEAFHSGLSLDKFERELVILQRLEEQPS